MPGNPRELITAAERRFPVRIRVAVPPSGLGQRHTQIPAWLDENCGADGWAMTPSGTRGVLNDALSIYFCGRYAGEHSSLASASRQRLRRLVGFGLRSRFPSQLSGSRYKMLGNTTSRITRAGETH